MTVGDLVDTTFDVRSDANGKDPDSHSATLRRYHRILWSKRLPTGEMFDLDEKLRHQSGLGDFWLSSDAITNTYRHWGRPARFVDILRRIPTNEMIAFFELGCTVGAYTVFPFAAKVDGKWRQTINQSRGIHPKIRDRFDLTLECIRRLYISQPSPLANALAPYNPFFRLFGDFPGYVDHFLLNDLVSDDYGSVRFWTSFDNFTTDALPAASVKEYREYMTLSMEFIRNRNTQIDRYVDGQSETHGALR